MPQYQGVWTLPVAARLQSTQQWATDPLYRNTTLLLQADNAANGAQNNTFLDSSSNNFTITRNGNTTQGTFTPYSLQPGAWSNFFNGTTDYLSVTDNAAFEFGNNNFTIEMWVYPTSTNQYQTFIGKDSAAGTRGFILTSDTRSLQFAVAAGALVATTQKFVTNQWNFITVTRSSNTIYLGINGIVESFSWTATIPDAASPLTIASQLTPGGVYVNYFPGYISNLRVVNGSSVATYQANFTPSTSPLTAITNTSLLTCQSNRFVDNSSNAFAITLGGTPSVQAFSPFAPQYQWTAPVIGGSGYFDGTGDYLDIANNAVLTPTGDFTIEFWAYPTSNSGVREWYSKGYGIQIYSYDTLWYVALSSSNAVSYYVNGSFGTLTANAWQHIVLTRSGNLYVGFVNGVATTLTTSASSPNTGTDVLRIGDFSGSAVYPVLGYMSSVRYVNGTVVYGTSNFTPPTAPLTAITNTQLLLNFTNAGIVDGTMKNNLETVGNAQISTSVVKYGTGSMAFDGTGDYLKSNVGTSDLYTFGTGDFTIEMWLYLTNVSVAQVIFDTRPASTNGVYPDIYFNNSGSSINWYISSADRITSSSVSINTWYHVAVCRSGTSTKMFINGTQAGSTYTDTNNYLCAAQRPIIGVNATDSSSSPFYGYIDDLRVTKGIARYTANFTPPTVALPRQ